VDGNKRIGFTAAIMFLELNGYRFNATEADATVRTLALACAPPGDHHVAPILSVVLLRRGVRFGLDARVPGSARPRPDAHPGGTKTDGRNNP
jgi:hypothetical protein